MFDTNEYDASGPESYHSSTQRVRTKDTAMSYFCFFCIQMVGFFPGSKSLSPSSSELVGELELLIVTSVGYCSISVSFFLAFVSRARRISIVSVAGGNHGKYVV